MMLSTVQLPGSSSFLLVCWVFATLTVSSFGAEISDVSSESEAFHDLDAFELINQGDAQGLAELLALGQDPNKKTGDGSSMLYLASKLGLVHIAETLLQAGAKVDGEEIHSGDSSLLASVTEEHIDVAKLLLSYGANPDKRNRAGESPREHVQEKERSDLISLILQFDKDGPMAFEDPPGTWRTFAEGNRNFYQNSETQEARWATPPSCAWNRQNKEDNMFVYYNKVTGQVQWTIPPALSWKFIMHKDHNMPMWYNFRTKRLQSEVPGELPQYLVDELMDDANSFWFNEASGEMQWEKPQELSWKQVTSDKGTFWFNEVTGRTQWEEPLEKGWKEAFSESGKYYWNEYTGEATFGKPEPLAWTLKKEL